MIQKFSFIALCIVFASCAASLPYSSDYPLTKEVFASRDNNFSGQIPVGWFTSDIDTLPSTTKAWLLKEDLSASFHIDEIMLDKLAARQVEKEGTTLLARLSIALHKEQSTVNTVLVQPKEFKMHGKEFCGYEINKARGQERVIVFSSKGKYYECVATPLKGNWTTENFKRLFAAQQTLLSSLMFP